MEPKLIITLIVLLLFIVMMLSGKFSFNLVGALCVTILVLTGVLTLAEGFAGLTDKNVLMVCGMLGIASQLGRTSIFDKMKDKMMSSGIAKSGFRLVIIIMAISCIFAQFMTSQSSIIMIMMPFLLAVQNDDVALSRLLLPMTLCMTSWMGRLPLGSTGLTTYMQLNSLIEASGGTQMLDLFSLMKCTLIPGIITIIYCGMFYRLMPVKEVDTSAYAAKAGKAQERLSPRNEKLIYIGFIVSVAGLLLSSKIGESGFIIPLAVDIALIMLKAMDGKEYLQTLVNGPVLMIAFCITIANAVTSSGVGSLIANGILTLLGGDPSPIVVVVLFGFVSLLMTTFLSNTATFMVLVPVAVQVCVAGGWDPRAAVIAVFSASLLSVITPMANTGSAICFSTCHLNISETWKFTIGAAVISLAAIIINSLIVYPM